MRCETWHRNQKHWSIDDVADAHEALDYFAHMEWLEMRKLK
jgi:hypothetical protein